MNLSVIRQGEDITFNFSEKNNEGQLVDLSQYDNVIVYLWTEVGKFKRFSREIKDKYSSIDVISSTEYQLKLTAEMTKTMIEGTVEMEIFVKDTDQRSIFRGQVFKLLTSYVKAEV